MPVPQEIIKLVERFEAHREAYQSGKYNEAQIRVEFIDPFFKALGWDVHNEQGHAEAYKDVVHEDALKIGGTTEAPDLCFRIGGTRKFFVECKKPSVSIKDEVHPAYQLRRYAWSAKLPLSILTDFDELAVYDCRVRPNKNDTAAVGRVMYLTGAQYAEKWDEFAAIFSREAVLKGSFDKYAEGVKGKRGTTGVDDVFLEEIERWRDLLAHNIALRNPKLTQRELNFAVQRTIDRIIFLRICEDRGIETYGRLLTLKNGERVYPRLCEYFQRADERYNSGLFHFQQEKERREAPDELTLNLKIDDKVLKDIVANLYYPESPYEFSVLPADILGQVYERFLGKVIRLTAGHQAKVEDKPEVRKAGGVYYTPTYIVDYIVKNTVGKLLEDIVSRKGAKSSGKAILQEVARLKILDPACGSGSFLLGAYQFLLDWHLVQYMKEPGKWAKGREPKLYQHHKGGWRLTTTERKRILLANIFGVDIDTQAVEVTKLSLLLKVLEGESQETIVKQYELFHQRALPDLGSNIKCGNSLIGPDFYQQQELNLLDDESRYRINAFDWQMEFPKIFEAGGFDVVMGNPPYIPIELMLEPEKQYYQTKYPQLERKYDSAPIFILAMLQKLQQNGRLGFISSVTWQTGENYTKLREHLFTKTGIENLINLPFDVFKNAYVDTGVYILTAKPTTQYSIYRFPKKETVSRLENIPFLHIPIRLIRPPEYRMVLDPNACQILQRALESKEFEQLGEFTVSTQGLAGNRFKTIPSLKNRDSYPFLQQGQARRYYLEINDLVYVDMSDKQSLKRYYEAVPRLLVRRVISRQDRLLTTFSDEKLVFKKDINPFIVTNEIWNTFFVLGVLNSQLISYLYVNTSSIATKDDFRQTTLAELRRLPIPKLFKGNACHDKMVSLVDRMLDLHKKLAAAKAPHDKESLQRQISATDHEIDRLVYELYGLTAEEIKIIEINYGR